MRACLVVNTQSGRSDSRKAAKLPKLLADRGIEIERSWLVPTDVELRKRVKRAAKSEAELIIVGGGDGSIATAVDVLAKGKTVLGVLPLGTGNSFARTIGIDDDDVATAIDALATGRVERVDLGRIDGTYFANFATIGLSSDIAEHVPRPLKQLFGAAAYVLAGFAPFFRARPFSADIAWDGGKRRIQTQQIVIASGRYYGHQPITPDASAVDHRLKLFTTTGVSHAEVARMYLALGAGLQNELPDAVEISAREIEIRTTPKQRISLDGNQYGKTPATFRVAPLALHVIVGPTFKATPE